MENNKTTQEIEQMKRKSDGSNIYPKTITEAVFDKESGIQLNDMIKSFNCIYLPQLQIPNVEDNLFGTRCLIPHKFRRPMMFVTRLDLNNKLVLEYYTGQCIEDHAWGDTKNWQKLINDDGNAVIVKSSEIQGDTLSFDEINNQLWINKINGVKDNAGQPLTYFKMVPNEGKNYFTLYGTKDPGFSSWEDSKWRTDGTFLGEVTNLLKVWKYFNDMDSALEDIDNIPDSGIIAIKHGDNWDLYAKKDNGYIRLGGMSVSVSGAIKTEDFEDNINNDDEPPTCQAVVDYFNSIKYERIIDPILIEELIMSISYCRYAYQMTDKGTYANTINALEEDNKSFISKDSSKIASYGKAAIFTTVEGVGVSVNQNSSKTLYDSKSIKVHDTTGGSNNVYKTSKTNGFIRSAGHLSKNYTIDEECDKSLFSVNRFQLSFKSDGFIDPAFFENQSEMKRHLKYKFTIEDAFGNIIYSIFSGYILNVNEYTIDIPSLFIGKSNGLKITINALYVSDQQFDVYKEPDFEVIDSATGEKCLVFKNHDKGTDINPDNITTPEIKTKMINGKDVSAFEPFDLFKLQKELLGNGNLSNKRYLVYSGGTNDKGLVNVKEFIQIIPGVEYNLYKCSINKTSSGLNITDMFDINNIPAFNGTPITSINNNLFYRKLITNYTNKIEIRTYDESFCTPVNTEVELPYWKCFEIEKYTILVDIIGTINNTFVHKQLTMDPEIFTDSNKPASFISKDRNHVKVIDFSSGDEAVITIKVIFKNVQQ